MTTTGPAAKPAKGLRAASNSAGIGSTPEGARRRQRRKRIAFLISTAVFSGGDKHLVELICRLDPDAFEPVIVCFGPDNFSAALHARQRFGVTVHAGLSRTAPRKTWWILRRIKPQSVVVVTGDACGIRWHQFLAARLSGARRVHAIYHNISDPLPPPSTRGSLPRRLACRVGGYRARQSLAARLEGMIADRYICIGRAVRERLVGQFHFAEAKAITAVNGVDHVQLARPLHPTQDLRERLGVGDGGVLMIVACRLIPTKGVDVLLQAMHALPEYNAVLKCAILGAGPSAEDLKKLASRLRLDAQVHWEGFQPDVRSYLHAGDMFINPSSATYVENLALSVIEAMACGLPCVASAAGGIPELIDNGVEGLLVSPGSVEAMAGAIARLASDPALRRAMGARARARSRREFDVEVCMRPIIETITR